MEHTSRELSQQLHDAGFRGEHKKVWGDRTSLYSKFDYDGTPAYTFTEIWGVLPATHPEQFAFKFLMHPFPDLSEAGYLQPEPWTIIKSWRGKSPAEAAGLLLLWLIQEGHVEVNGG